MTTDTIDFTGPFKLEVRQGLQVELPGQPISPGANTPLGLDSGEIALAIDTGDVYIGSNPSYVIFDSTRLAEFPYANIHILTESANSVAFIQNAVSNQQRYTTTTFAANSSGDTVLSWITSVNNIVEVSYMLCFSNLTTAVRRGNLTIVMNSTAGVITDNRTDIGFTVFDYTDLTDTGLTAFEFSIQVVNGVATLQYTNATSYPAMLYYFVTNLNATY
jgi:hypothetical protein